VSTPSRSSKIADLPSGDKLGHGADGLFDLDILGGTVIELCRDPGPSNALLANPAITFLTTHKIIGRTRTFNAAFSFESHSVAVRCVANLFGHFCLAGGRHKKVVLIRCWDLGRSAVRGDPSINQARSDSLASRITWRYDQTASVDGRPERQERARQRHTAPL